MRHASRHRQQGAVIVTVSLLMLFLLGFIAFALDFGKLFVVKTELQTAMDACALSAAQELNGANDAMVRGRSAGRTAGNLNHVNFQSATWSGMGQLVDADITFRDSDYAVITDPTQGSRARYAQCQHVQPAVQLWLLQAMGAFSGNTTLYTNHQNVTANAVATRASAQNTCPVPLGLNPKPGFSTSPWGFEVGEWVTLLESQPSNTGGQIGWFSLTEDNGESAIKAQLNGFCGIHITSTLRPSNSGAKQALAEAWNYRFGIYKGNALPDFTVDPDYMRPDLTGYSYSSKNWTSQFNAYPDFASKRVDNAACATTIKLCESTGNWTLNANFKSIALAGTGTGSHGAMGADRRVVTTPVVDASNSVTGFACMLMLEPHYAGGSPQPIHLEFLGDAAATGSPCVTNGLPGGSAGPKVPTLVR